MTGIKSNTIREIKDERANLINDFTEETSDIKRKQIKYLLEQLRTEEDKLAKNTSAPRLVTSNTIESYGCRIQITRG